MLCFTDIIYALKKLFNITKLNIIKLYTNIKMFNDNYAISNYLSEIKTEVIHK